MDFWEISRGFYGVSIANQMFLEMATDTKKYLISLSRLEIDFWLWFGMELVNHTNRLVSLVLSIQKLRICEITILQRSFVVRFKNIQNVKLHFQLTSRLKTE